MAGAKGPIAAGAWAQEPSGVGQPAHRQWHSLAHSHRGSLARRTGEIREVVDRIPTISTLEPSGCLGGGGDDLAQAMADNARHSIDSTTVRGHVSAAVAKGGLANRLLAARGAGSPVKFVHCLSDARGL